MAKFTAENRLGNLSDVQKTFMWELAIPPVPGVDGFDMEDMIVRCRNVQIPGRTIEPIISNFMGTKQNHTGLTTYTGQFTTQFEEYEDQKVIENINNWMELMFNYDEGKAEAATKKDLVAKIQLIMYTSDGTKLPKRIEFINTWPQGIADAPLDYATGDSVKYDVTWQYDYWRLVNN